MGKKGGRKARFKEDEDTKLLPEVLFLPVELQEGLVVAELISYAINMSLKLVYHNSRF